MSAAAPMPVPMHMLTMPKRLFVRLSSGISVAICLAPVHPNGWPNAMAPPFGLTLAGSSPSTYAQYTAWLANASFSSNISTSSIASPVNLSNYGMAILGPIPITSGSHPATVYSTNLATMGSPKRSAADRDASNTTAAPSLT
jgi:uncharacterized membrane protein